MEEDYLKLIGIIIISCIIIYTTIFSFKTNKKIVEGLTNSSTTGTNGVAANATKYASGLKSKTVQLQDELLIPKYRTDYETVIINAEDYVNTLTLKELLTMNLSDTSTQDNMTIINNLNTLNTAKISLNSLMEWLDKQ